MWVKHFFPQYKGEIGIGDGVRGFNTTAKRIVCQEENGNRQIVKTGPYRGKTAITEWKKIEAGKIMEWLKFGAFFKFRTPQGMVTERYHPSTNQRRQGWTERPDGKVFGEYGSCKTFYSYGKFTRQIFTYENRRRAFSFHHTDKRLKVKYSNGKLALDVSCPAGFQILSNDGMPFFEREKDEAFESASSFDFSKHENCIFVHYSRTGKVWNQGEYRNGQRSGEWTLKGKSVYFIQGVPVEKKLWDTPPAKMKFKSILKIKNTQLRAALIARAGYERLAKELKYKLIHEDKRRRNKLMEFPIKVESANYGTASWLRILQVTCTSTGTKYFLNVPDFIWDGGKKTKLNTCEQARQWTFGNDDPRKNIKFQLET